MDLLVHCETTQSRRVSNIGKSLQTTCINDVWEGTTRSLVRIIQRLELSEDWSSQWWCNGGMAEMYGSNTLDPTRPAIRMRLMIKTFERQYSPSASTMDESARSIVNDKLVRWCIRANHFKTASTIKCCSSNLRCWFIDPNDESRDDRGSKKRGESS